MVYSCCSSLHHTLILVLTAKVLIAGSLVLVALATSIGEPSFFQQMCLVPTAVLTFLLLRIVNGIRRGDCYGCSMLGAGPKTKLVIKLDLSCLTVFRNEFLRHQKSVSDMLIEEHGLPGTYVRSLEVVPNDIGITLYAGYLCRCASVHGSHELVNELLNAARSTVWGRDYDRYLGLRPFLRFCHFERVGNEMVYGADGSNLLDNIRLSMSRVSRGFLVHDPHETYMPYVGMYRLDSVDLRYVSSRLIEISRAHDKPTLRVPYSWFLGSKDGVWHLQDVFRVKLSSIDSVDGYGRNVAQPHLVVRDHN